MLRPGLRPLTPALYPTAGERENGRQSLSITGRIRIADRLPRLPPLPCRGGTGVRGKPTVPHGRSIKVQTKPRRASE